jgi:thiol:disulfide interchange protein
MLETEFVCAQIDLTDSNTANGALAAELGVRGIPALHVYDAEGTRLGTRTGLCTPPELIVWLRDCRRQ